MFRRSLHRYLLLASLTVGFLAAGWPAQVAAQAVNVPFRYPVEGNHVSASLPGTFNGWNNGSSTAMARVDSLAQWYKRQTFTVGQTVQYKFFVTSSSGTNWITDPYNPRTNPSDNNNSVLTVADPMVVQIIPQFNGDGLVSHVTAGIVASASIQSLTLSVAGATATDVLYGFNPASGVLRIALDSPVVDGTRFEVSVTTEDGIASSAYGSLVGGLTLQTPSRRTVMPSIRLQGLAADASGGIDPDLSSVRILRNGQYLEDLPVANGQIDGSVALLDGENTLRLEAEIAGQAFVSEEVVITKWNGPLQDRLFDLVISGEESIFTIGVVETESSSGLASIEFIPDERLSTTDFMQFIAGGGTAVGSASGEGELYVTVKVRAVDGRTDQARAAIRVGADGAVSTFDWAEKASWIDQAVVYEIFPFAFGPVEATGSVGAEGNRLNEIRHHLDYIKEMGFNTIWFMPIMRNVDMSGWGAGYNIIDFRTVDPKLGTNEDLRALVDRAHELGLRVVLDLTVNHSSEDHPWVQSLAAGGTYSEFIQTTPSAYNRGLDGSGPYLTEQWSDNGLYRVFDGFGQLANLNWDDDDLQAEMLDIIQYWLTEFNVDGYRFDAYWGPWKRYGPERFGRPIREVMRRVRPDAWSLGELAGTGVGTEVYYADDAFGTRVAGGLDAAYDWDFSHFLRNPSNYGNTAAYRSYIPNYNFVPGPNARFFRFLENHDEPRIQEVFKANTDRLRPLTGMLMTIPGIPMIYQGQEVGYGQGSGDRRRLPVNFTTERNGEWAAFHRYLAVTRARFPAFGTQDVRFLSSSSSTLAFVRPYLDENAVVAINFAGAPRTFTLDPSDAIEMSTDGPVPYYDVVADTLGTHVDGFTVTLPPFSITTWITSEDAALDLGPLPRLPFGAVYTSRSPSATLPDAATLSAPWPNPTRISAQIAWTLPSHGSVRISLFDMLGRRVALLEDGVRSAGTYESRMDVGHLSPGVYHIVMEADSRRASRALIIVD